MAWINVVDDNFTRADTTAGAAGTTTGAGNNWTDVLGNVWNISTNRLRGVSTVNHVKDDFLTRPVGEDQRDARIILNGNTVGSVTRGCVLRYQPGTKACYWVVWAAGFITVQRFDGTTITTLTGGSLTYTYTAGRNTEMDFSLTGASPTTWSLTLTDTDTSTVLKTATGTDSAGPQTSGQYGINIGDATGTQHFFTRARTYRSQALSTVLPASIGINTVGNVLTLTGLNTTWLISLLEFTLSGGTGASITAQNIVSDTSATITVNAGSAAGTLTITDPSSGSSLPVTVANSTLTPSVYSIPINNTISVALLGFGTNWTAGTPGSPTFTLSGGTGASIVSQSVTDTTHATLSIAAGSALGLLTITDPSTGAVCVIQADYAWANIVDDNFTRADSALGTIGNNWTDELGTIFNIDSNTLKSVGSAAGVKTNHALRPSGENQTDQRIVLDASSLNGNQAQWGAIFRHQSNHDGYALLAVNPLISGFSTFAWFRLVSGTATLIQSVNWSVAYTSDHTYAIDVSVVGTNPTTLRAYLRDTTTGAVLATNVITDSAATLQTSGQYGIVTAVSAVTVKWTRARTYKRNVLSVSPSTVGIGTSTSLTLTGTNTAWTPGTPGSPTFTVSGGTGAGLSAQVVSSGTAATVTLAAGSTAGTLTLVDPSTGASVTITVPPPSFSITPARILPNQTGVVLTLAGYSNSWTPGTPGAPTFTASGVAGVTITGQTVLTANSATVTVNTGANSGTLTITDPVSGATAITLVQNIVSVSDVNWFFSPYNWRYNAALGAMETNMTGAYMKVKFGGTSAVLQIDPSLSIASGLVGGGYPGVIWRIDDGALSTFTALGAATTALTLATGLAAGEHTLWLMVLRISTSTDSWQIPANLVRITGLQIDGSQVLTAPTLHPKRALFYGDSITGADVLDVPALSQPSGTLSNSFYSWVNGAALGLDAEFGMLGINGVGWTIENSSHVVPFFTPGNDDRSNWNKYWAGQSRLVGGLLSPAPDYIFCGYGTNGVLRKGAIAAEITAAVTGWLSAVRVAAPRAHIFMVLPFGGYDWNHITAGFDAYRAATPDNKAHLVTPPAEFVAPLSLEPTPSYLAPQDGLHPGMKAHGFIGAALTSEAKAILDRRAVGR